MRLSFWIVQNSSDCQQSDPGLPSLFEQAEKGDQRYFVKSGVLRAWRDKLAPPESSIHPIVVPVSLRSCFSLLMRFLLQIVLH